jgi:NAD(P)H-binding
LYRIADFIKSQQQIRKKTTSKTTTTAATTTTAQLDKALKQLKNKMMILNRMTTMTTTTAAAAATRRSRCARLRLRGSILPALAAQQQPNTIHLLFCLLLLLLGTHQHPALALSASTSSASGASASAAAGLSKVAVIGTTGRLGRQVVQQLSDMGISTIRCLQRPAAADDEKSNSSDAAVVVVKSLQDAQTSQQVASYLKTLPGVEMIAGDVTDIDSLRRLLVLDSGGDDCVDACFAVHGAGMPKPFYKGLFAPLLFNEDLDPRHPKQVNYVGVQNILKVLQECNNNNKKKKNKKVPRLVRITGKGEEPWSVFSILINALGGMAKAWNYEAEQLIRSTKPEDLDYTIIRPGIMKERLEQESKDEETAATTTTTTTLGLRDNGGDLPVTAVSYAQIAQLAIHVATRDNCQRATLTAMNRILMPTTSRRPSKTNVDNDDQDDDDDDDDDAKVVVYQTIDQVQPDTRTTFPTTLLHEHKRAARVGGIAIIVLTLLLANLVASLVLRLFGLAF